MRRAAAHALQVPLIAGLLLPHYAVGVVGICTNESDEILLLHHTYRHHYPWGLPAGFLERGEQPAAALHRELREEAGLEVDLDPVWTVNSEMERALVNVVFTGRILGGEFRPNVEVREARFFSPATLPSLMPGQQLLLADYFRERERI